jgi:hypothetical protein
MKAQQDGTVYLACLAQKKLASGRIFGMPPKSYHLPNDWKQLVDSNVIVPKSRSESPAAIMLQFD